jgi:hypothetical protein
VEREHLESHEIESLLDGETGPAESAASAHMLECDACSALYLRAREQVEALELLPYRSPSAGFSDRVMSQVRVFEPWHVTILDAIGRWLPTGRGARLALGGAAASMGLVLTSLLIWVATRADALVFIGNLTFERGRVVSMGFAQDASVALLGEPTASMLGLRGMRGLWFTVGLLGASTFVSTIAMRMLASAARRRKG